MPLPLRRCGSGFVNLCSDGRRSPSHSCPDNAPTPPWTMSARFWADTGGRCCRRGRSRRRFSCPSSAGTAPAVLFTKRTDRLNHHRGEISFSGGVRHRKTPIS